MCAVLTLFQQFHKPAHQLCALVREVILRLVDLCMKIKEIDNHALYRVAGQIQIEPMAFFFVPRAHVFHIFIAPLLLAGIEVHHRIIEKHHLTAHAVIAERGGHLCKFRRYVDGYGTEIGAGVCYLRQLAATDDQAITNLQWELRAVEKQRRRPLQTQRVRQIARMREL